MLGISRSAGKLPPLSSFETLEDRRLMSAGALDVHFGPEHNGIAQEFGDDVQQIRALVPLPGGKTLALGIGYDLDYDVWHGADLLQIRYNADGSRDTTFGNDGMLLTDLSGHDDVVVNAFAVGGGKIVAGISLGTRDNTNGWRQAGFIRLNADGSLDSTFGDHGVARGPDSMLGYLDHIAVQPDGKIVGVGSMMLRDGLDGYDQYLIRIDANGHLDESFGNGGIVRSSFAELDWARGIAIDSDGRILTATLVDYTSTIVRYDSSGNLDTSFGNKGLVQIGGSYDLESTSLVVRPDGRILAITSTDGNSGTSFLVHQLNADGSLDMGWGSLGTSTINLNGYGDAHSLELQTDGKLILVGRISEHFAVIRYDLDGSLDNTFANHGVVVTEFKGVAFDAAVQSDGQILVGGSKMEQYGALLIRLDGDQDVFPATLGNDGILHINGTSFDDHIAVGVRDGRLLVQVNGDLKSYALSSIASVWVIGGDGEDLITLGNYTGSTRVWGGNGDDTIIGGAGSDLLLGGAGNDQLLGGVGNDRLYGEAGNDILVAGAGNDSLYGGDGDDRMYGGDGADFLDGSGGADQLNGETGNDRMSGGTGNDRLNGATGNDSMTGGDGADLLSGSDGKDTLGGGTGNDKLDGGTAEDKLLGDIGNDLLTGGSGADTLTGNAGNDTLNGGDGADQYQADRSDQLIGFNDPIPMTLNTAKTTASSSTHDVLISVVR